jgi:hypothetical protein
VRCLQIQFQQWMHGEMPETVVRCDLWRDAEVAVECMQELKQNVLRRSRETRCSSSMFCMEFVSWCVRLVVWIL